MCFSFLVLHEWLINESGDIPPPHRNSLAIQFSGGQAPYFSGFIHSALYIPGQSYSRAHLSLRPFYMRVSLARVPFSLKSSLSPFMPFSRHSRARVVWRGPTWPILEYISVSVIPGAEAGAEALRDFPTQDAAGSFAWTA